MIENRVNEWKEGGNSFSQGDLLDLILACDKEKKLTPDEIRHNIFLFFIAGHETRYVSSLLCRGGFSLTFMASSGVLTSAMYYMARRPDIQEAAFQEVQRVLGMPPIFLK